MNRTLMIAAALGLALTTSACSGLRAGQADGGDAASMHMGGSAGVDIDPAGSATLGTGSPSHSGYDSRVDFASGIGLDP